jgi:beta-glucosidase
MARVAADETRAKTNGEYGRFRSQDYLHSNVIWTPVVNICRDARWGRCQETLGECPFLTSELGATLVRAFQSGGLDNNRYLEVIATAKHFDVHGGPESASLDVNGKLVNTNRMSFKVNISRRDWVTMHQPAFEATVRAGVTSVMCSCTCRRATLLCDKCSCR